MNNKLLRWYLLSVDISFIIYWGAALLDLFPGEMLFNNYHDDVITAWNWSFFPIDIIASFIGLSSIYIYKKNVNRHLAMQLANISLSMIFCAGMMALSFWVLTEDYSISWWVANLYLAIPSAGFLYKFMIVKQSVVKQSVN